MHLPRLFIFCALFAFTSAGCTKKVSQPAYLRRDALLDPNTCASCHADHFHDWSRSMHAYAAKDPVFLAMNQRGQRETDGGLGDFCVQCHAPMAVREGATHDGLNLANVPEKLKGVTCFFCHTTDAVMGAHNNPLSLANDTTMRGPITEAVANSAHASSYSSLHDRDNTDSSAMCGSCHDVTNGHGTSLERTFAEWNESVFASVPGGTTCSQCHMDRSAVMKPIVTSEDAGVPARYVHAHDFPGIDLPLTNEPGRDLLRSRVQELLDTTLQSALCVGANSAGISVILDNVAAGHGFPSGAAQDRRAYVEVIAYAGANVIFSSGVVADGADVAHLTGDPNLWLMRDCMLDANQQSVPMFWQAVSVESVALPAQLTFNALDPRFYQSHLIRTFPRDTALSQMPDRVTMRVRVQAIGLDVIDDLIASGDLDPAYRNKVPTFDIGAMPLVTWTAAAASQGYVDSFGTAFSCVTNTNLNFMGQTTRAPEPLHCGP